MVQPRASGFSLGRQEEREAGPWQVENFLFGYMAHFRLCEFYIEKKHKEEQNPQNIARSPASLPSLKQQPIMW